MVKIENCILCDAGDKKILNRRGILEKGKPDRVFDNVICKNCGLVFMDPQPEGHEYAAIYKEYEKNRHNCGEDDIGSMAEIMAGKEKTEQIYNFVKEYLESGKKVLDIGAGFGQISRAFKDKFNCGVLAIEPSERLAAYLKEKFNLPVFHGGLDEYLQSGTDEKFNLLVLNHVFEHFTDPAEKLQQFKSLLSSDGAVYMEIPNVYSFKKPVDHFFDYCHPYSYSPKTLKELAYKNGFKIIKLNKEKKYRLQFVLAPQESRYPDAGGDDFWRFGGFEDTQNFIFKRRIIDWIKNVSDKIRGL